MSIANFWVHGKYFKTMEHFIMYQKAMLFENKELAHQILTTENQYEVKKLGRQVKGFSAEVWKRERIALLLEANYEKFTQNKIANQYLLATKNLLLAEASPTDRDWGIGFSLEDPRRFTISKWGNNFQGNVLMTVRSFIR